MYPFSPKPPAHPGCHIKLSRVPLYIWASQVAQRERICLPSRRPEFDTWVGKLPWRRDRLPTPVFWPGEFHELYSPWGCKESDMTEQLSLSPLYHRYFLSPFPFVYLSFFFFPNLFQIFHISLQVVFLIMESGSSGINLPFHHIFCIPCHKMTLEQSLTLQAPQAKWSLLTNCHAISFS